MDKTEPGAVDVLNGFRGVVTTVSPDGERIQWRRNGDDGRPQVFSAELSAARIAAAPSPTATP
ncbi:hypothetical protein RM572_02055 [Streptomyces sp. DSM 42041]|uniref:Uncharacterized protein n=1 Tax=Streptomyces hazeniae TaxID=3075538 RepID=A0ABU2NMW4_9ACTN|nr:hypothetical protein [Streptomyces sp. DSM 42041]MDT0377558.1 hypothetical protein [Streptomyces sp. DSM 42041]